MAKEGNLEAPTRHPIDWKNPDFYDEDKLHHELERIFDICHGCRRCVSLCDAFPTLFDLVDESDTLEVDGVDKKDYTKVVDQCYMCDLCYMTKCPYVPPHEWNVDFPHTMLRAKAIQFKKGSTPKGAKLLSSTDTIGMLSGIPVVTQMVNQANKKRPIRQVIETTLGVDKDAWLPELAVKPFKRHIQVNKITNTKNGGRTPGKVAIFATCYINYNEPGIGHDLLKILQHNDIAYEVIEKEKCCGMPKLELGDLDSVAKSKEANIPLLYEYAKNGFAILSAVPSCTLMFKQEIPLLFPEDEQVKLVQQAIWDPFEYLSARHKDKLLKDKFSQPLGNIAYQVPCHSRVQNIGKKTEELLTMVPDTKVKTVMRCSGHAGTYGVKKETHKTAMKIGTPVFKSMAKMQDGRTPDYISSDCPLGGHHIQQGFNEKQLGNPTLAHPLTLIRQAYGLE
jgi:Fe-S oxidoreductase